MSKSISRMNMINLAQQSPTKHPPAINIIVHMFVYVCSVVSPLRTGHTLFYLDLMNLCVMGMFPLRFRVFTAGNSEDNLLLLSVGTGAVPSAFIDYEVVKNFAADIY